MTTQPSLRRLRRPVGNVGIIADRSRGSPADGLVSRCGRLRHPVRPSGAAQRVPVGPLRPDRRLRAVQPGLAADRHRPPQPLRHHLPLVLSALRLSVLPSRSRAHHVAARPLVLGVAARHRPPDRPRRRAGRSRARRLSVGSRTSPSARPEPTIRPRGGGLRAGHLGAAALDLLGGVVRLPLRTVGNVLRAVGRP